MIVLVMMGRRWDAERGKCRGLLLERALVLATAIVSVVAACSSVLVAACGLFAVRLYLFLDRQAPLVHSTTTPSQRLDVAGPLYHFFLICPNGFPPPAQQPVPCSEPIAWPQRQRLAHVHGSCSPCQWRR